MKIGIITIIDFYNYGNRLQNIAVEKILQEYGYETETFVWRCRDTEESGFSIRKRIKRALPYCLYKKIKQYRENRLDSLDRQRALNFLEFSKKYTHLSEEVWFDKDFSAVIHTEDYQYFVTGSDQVWNPDFAGSDMYFLTFAEPEKRIAIAASIGYDKLDVSLREYYSDRLSQMKYISVREVSAQKLVRKLTGREADYMIDPTLIVDSSYWLSISKCPQLEFPQKYILSFFLGEEAEEEIEIISESLKLPVIHMNQKRFAKWYVLSPSHFLYMLKYAEYVLTDSFHAVAFSINFNTSFYVFKRKDKVLKNMFSRMETLLKMFCLEERIYDFGSEHELACIESNRWDNVNRILTQERKKSLQWLSMALREEYKV